MSKKRFRLITAVITITAFLSTSVAAGPAPVRRNASETFDIDAFSLPAGLGEVSSVLKGTNGRTIIHIQDAHCNYNAQHSIADIISNLSGLYKADLVFLEGGAGNYNFSVFDRIKDPGTRERVSDHFVKEGIVNGPEFFAINNPGKAEFFGIEDESLYFKNLKIYRDSLAFKKEADSNLKILSAAMDNLKSKAYSTALKELDEKMAAHRDYKISFKAYAAYLKEKAEVNFIAIAPYKNLSSLFTTIKIESAINFKKAERERGLLVDKIGTALSKTEIKELENKAALYKAGELPSEAFYSYLFRKAKIANADFKVLPNLVKYSEYLKTYESIDKVALLKEIKDVEGLIADKLAKTEDQRNIWRLDKNLTILKAIFNTSLIKEDFDYYNAHKDDFDVKNFTSFFVKKGPAYGLKFTPDERLNRLDSFRGEMEKFYDYSIKRDDAFLKNIEAKLGADKKNVAILVTGGFHSANLFKLFKDKGYSYAKVMPKFKADQGDNPYFNLLAGGMTPMQEFLKTAVSYTPEKATLAIETPFSQMNVPETVKNIIGLEINAWEQLDKVGTFTIEGKTGFIVVSKSEIEGALKQFKLDLELEGKPISLYANVFSVLPGNFKVDAVLLDKKSMAWSRSAGITAGKPGQGPQAIGTKGSNVAPEYSEIVNVIRRGKVEVSDINHQNGQMLEPDQGVVVKGRAGEPTFRVALKTRVEPSGRTYLEAPQPEGSLAEWGTGMIEFDRAVLKSLAERPLAPEREYRVYIEHPVWEKSSRLKTLATFEVSGLNDTVTMQKIGNVTFIMFTPEDRQRIFNEIADAPDNISIATFALKAKEEGKPEQNLRSKMENRSYAVYMELKSDNSYVPVRTCGMTAFKIFDYQHIQRQIEQNFPVSISDQNQAVELVARGIGLLCGANTRDVIGLIAKMDNAGKLELLKSGLIFVTIQPYDINQINELNKMARLVREAV